MNFGNVLQVKMEFLTNVTALNLRQLVINSAALMKNMSKMNATKRIQVTMICKWHKNLKILAKLQLTMKI